MPARSKPRYKYRYDGAEMVRRMQAIFTLCNATVDDITEQTTIRYFDIVRKPRVVFGNCIMRLYDFAGFCAMFGISADFVVGRTDVMQQIDRTCIGSCLALGKPFNKRGFKGMVLHRGACVKERFGLTDVMTAEGMGTPMWNYKRWLECGMITSTFIYAFCEAFDISYDYMLGFTEDMHAHKRQNVSGITADRLYAIVQSKEQAVSVNG